MTRLIDAAIIYGHPGAGKTSLARLYHNTHILSFGDYIESHPELDKGVTFQKVEKPADYQKFLQGLHMPAVIPTGKLIVIDHLRALADFITKASDPSSPSDMRLPNVADSKDNRAVVRVAQENLIVLFNKLNRNRDKNPFVILAHADTQEITQAVGDKEVISMKTVILGSNTKTQQKGTLSHGIPIYYMYKDANNKYNFVLNEDHCPPGVMIRPTWHAQDHTDPIIYRGLEQGRQIAQLLFADKGDNTDTTEQEKIYAA